MYVIIITTKLKGIWDFV